VNAHTLNSNIRDNYSGSSTPTDIMISWWFCLAALSISLALAQQQLHNAVNATGAPGACGLELIWPPSDGIVLLATDSQEVQIYLKLWGDCSEFLRPSTMTPTRLGLYLGFIFYETTMSRNSVSALEQMEASPLDMDHTPVHIRLMRSPLLAKSGNVSRPRDTSGHDASEQFLEFSVWTFALIPLKNVGGLHDLETTFAVFEVHLITNLSAPFTNIPVPSTILNFRLLGRPSSHFFLVTPRYTSIPGYVCLSACGTMCNQISARNISGFRHSLLLTTHSPVCTRINQAVNLTLAGPAFFVQSGDGGHSSAGHHAVLNPNMCGASDACPSDVVFVTIGGDASGAHTQGSGHDISVTGLGRHRLLSVIATVLNDTVGFVFLKTRHSRVDNARVTNMIQQFDLVSSYAFIAFRMRRFAAMRGARVDHEPSVDELPLPAADFGSIHDGILLSRAAAVVMLMAWSDEMSLHLNETLPAACSEYLIFSDAWLCWCAAELDIPALDFRFSANNADSMFSTSDCAASSPLYGKLAHLYEQQRLSISSHMNSLFTERTTLGFQYFMQTLLFHLVKSPRILHISDDEERGDSMFWDLCCSQLLANYMLFPLSLSAHVGLHPLLQLKWDALASSSNRSAFVAMLRAAIMFGGIHGREIVNSSMPFARRRVRMSVSATRVLGCGVQSFGSFRLEDGDLLRGKVGPDDEIVKPLQLNVITPAVILMKHAKPVSRQLYLATHDDWSSVFGYNPLFSKDASLAFAAPEFGAQDWHWLCMLAVLSMTGRTVQVFDAHSREYLACSAFATAVSQRTYATAMPRCFDAPPQILGALRYMAYGQEHAEYLKYCQAADDARHELNDDPWLLRPLAGAVQALLLERWDLQQVRMNFECREKYMGDLPFDVLIVRLELVRGVAAPA
jgi:hypothetical protein